VKTIFLALGLITLVPQAKAEDATSAALALSWQEFDQTPHSGWRAIGEDAKRYQEAAALIEAYLARHTELDQSRKAILHWHALQMLATAGDTAAALKHIPFTRLDPLPPNPPVLWNDYVDATEAFLRHDRPKLLAARERIASNKPDDANLPFVDAFISHFEEPYAKAYGATK
jgi:hypothetical protein